MAFDPQTLGVRLVKGKDGRDVLQMRVDMGILQPETTGRPDGESYEGHESVLEFLQQTQLLEPDHSLYRTTMHGHRQRVHAVLPQAN